MKKILLALACTSTLFLMSCASTPYATVTEFPEIEAGELPSSRYIILGEVSGVSSIYVKTSDLAKETEGEFEAEKKPYSTKIMTDTYNYGFIGKPAKLNMNVFEKGRAIAEYKLIDTARYNGADAVIATKATTSIKPQDRLTVIETTVSGFAVKIKPDAGYSIQEPVEEEEDEVVLEEEETSEEDSVDEE